MGTLGLLALLYCEGSSKAGLAFDSSLWVPAGPSTVARSDGPCPGVSWSYG